MSDEQEMTSVGSVGLGAMGRPIAGFIAQAGFDVVAYDLVPDRVPEGVRRAGGLAEVAAADIVIVIVPTDDDVIDVIGGEGGLIANGHPGMIIVISASVRPATCRALAEQAAPAGIHVIDAALTGGVRGAETATINLLVGGDPEVVARAHKVFRSFASSVHVLGRVGAGQVGKSANNLLHWAQIVAINESMRLAREFGVEPAVLRRALQDGPTDSRTLRELEHMRFTWYVKDIEIAEELARGVGVPLPVAGQSRRLMDDITVQGIRELLDETG